jgi:hypothetical protein
MSDRPLERRAKAAVERAAEIGTRTRQTAARVTETRFAARQARTVAQMVRWLGGEKRKGR